MFTEEQTRVEGTHRILGPEFYGLGQRTENMCPPDT